VFTKFVPLKTKVFQPKNLWFDYNAKNLIDL